MKILRLKVKNWKNFQSIDVTLKDIMFLTGPNASGKSNFIEIFRFLHDIVKRGGGLQQSIEDHGGFSKIRCLFARSHPNVEIEVHLGDENVKNPTWVYTLKLMQEQAGLHRSLIESEEIIHDGKTVYTRPDKFDKKDKELLLSTHLEQATANKNFREISHFFQSFKYFHLVPQLIRYPQYFQGKGMPEDPYGQHFLDYLANQKSPLLKSRMKKITLALKIVVPQLVNLEVVKDKSGHPHFEARFKNWRPRAAKFSEDQLSDGTLRLIGLLWSILETKDAVLLLEEPELSLNSGVNKNLVPLIYEIQKTRKNDNCQIIISTHSWDLLSYSGISGDEILLFRPSRNGTEIEIASSDVEIQSLLDSGMPPSDAIFPYITPKNISSQLTLLEF